MKILYVNPDGDLGGAQRSLLDLVTAVRFADPGVEVLVLAGMDGPFVHRAESLGVDVRLVPMPASLMRMGDSSLKYGGRGREILSLAMGAPGASLGTYAYARTLRRETLRIAPSIVHTNTLKSHLLASMSSPRVPLLWHIRDFLGTRRMAKHALRWAAPRATAALAISEAVARDVRHALPGLPVHVLYNAIDTSTFSPGPAETGELDTRGGLPDAPEGTVRIGLVATYALWKGHGVFLEACSLLAQEPPSRSVRFYVIGGPIYRTRGSQNSMESLRMQARALGLDGRVGFLGFLENPAPAYRALDIVVHASTEPEPFGRTIVEGMACGRPVVVSSAGGASELFEDGKDAVAFKPGDVPGLAAVMRRLVDDTGLRRRLGESGRATALRRFSLPRLGQEALALYRRVLSGRDG